MKKYLFILFLLSSLKGFTQGENNIWYFGYFAGLDFNSGSPVAISGGQTNTREGVASVSDAAGNLLFYSDGITVWDKMHAPMPNGFGLHGDPSSTQSATIVPVPGVPSQYYLFTCPEIAANEDLYYSIVDMTLNGGNGDITAVKNVSLLDSATEQCTVIPAVNGCYWLVSRKYSSFFYAWLIDPSGIQPPVISNCGAVISTGNAQGLGYMKASPLNNKIGVAYYASTFVNSFFELYDFDNATGVVSNAFQFTTGTSISVYSCAFSPDGSKFYGAEWGPSIFQYDMNAANQAAFLASQTFIGSPGGSVGAMQIAPDQKIYLTCEGTGSISVIDNPNALGLACNFQLNTIPLGGNICGIGLPGKVLFCNTIPNAAFIAPNHICPGTCTDFVNNSTNATSYIWSFPGGSPAVSTDVNPVNICYNTPGQYTVSLIATNSLGSDTLQLNNFITVYPYPAPQGIIQNGDTLFANQGAVTYQWYQDGVLITGATDYYYIATASGNYNVVATDDNGCEVEAAIFDVIAGIHSVDGSSQLVIFPNPVSDVLTVTGENLAGADLKFSIYNLLGEKVFDIQANPLRGNKKWQLDVSKLTAGIYWLSISQKESVARISFTKH